VGSIAGYRIRQTHAESERRVSNRRRVRKQPPYVALYRHAYKSAAYGALSAVAQAALMHLIYNYNTKLCNSVFLSARNGAKKLNVSKNTAARALCELEYYGFIAKVKSAYLGVEGVGQAAIYRLTDRLCGNSQPTHDYEKWDGEIFDPKKQNPVPAEGHPVPPEVHKAPGPRPPKTELPSQQRDIRNASACPTRGTYLVLPAAQRSSEQPAGGSIQPETVHGPEREDPERPMTALREWSPPVIIAIPCTPEVRRLRHRVNRVDRGA
jgi:hypothetical protein